MRMKRQDLVRELVRSKDPQSWNIPDVGNELSSNCSSKERRPKPKNFLWKRVPLPEVSKSASKIEHGWRLFLKSFHSPIPHTPVLIIIWWNGKKTYIICPLINALHWFNGHVIKLVLPFHQYVTHVYFWSNYGINWLLACYINQHSLYVIRLHQPPKDKFEISFKNTTPRWPPIKDSHVLWIQATKSK